MEDRTRYNPEIHHRRSIRLKGYDYSQEGLYFITICCQDRACLFGEIGEFGEQGRHACLPVQDIQQNGKKMILNDAGKMVAKWYFELENKYHDIQCNEMVVMPNHFHCIIENAGRAVGANLCVRPDNEISMDEKGEHGKIMGEHGKIMGEHGKIMGEHTGSPLHRIVQWFKTMTTNEYIRGVKMLGWKRFDGKLWQRNYYEHIIRNEKSYQTISDYIINNPAKWAEDKFYMQ